MIIDITKELFVITFIIGITIAFFLKKYFKYNTRYIIIVSFIIYLICLLKITVFPIIILDSHTINRLHKSVGEYMVFYQLIPFASIKNYFSHGASLQLVGNIILLIPFVIYIEIFTKSKLNSYKEIVLIILTSICIEVTQLSISYITRYPNRICDIDDVLLNSVGGVLSMIIIRMLKSYLHNHPTQYSRLRSLIYN